MSLPGFGLSLSPWRCPRPGSGAAPCLLCSCLSLAYGSQPFCLLGIYFRWLLNLSVSQRFRSTAEKKHEKCGNAEVSCPRAEEKTFLILPLSPDPQKHVGKMNIKTWGFCGEGHYTVWGKPCRDLLEGNELACCIAGGLTWQSFRHINTTLHWSSIYYLHRLLSELSLLYSVSPVHLFHRYFKTICKTWTYCIDIYLNET